MAKKNDMTPLLLGAGALAAVYFLMKKKAHAAEPVPDPTGDIDISEPTDKPPTDEPLPTKKKKKAPPFPGVHPSEFGVVQALHATWQAAVGDAMAELGESEGSPSGAALELAKANAGIPKGQKVYENIADDALLDLYGIKSIPAGVNRGTGWQPFIDAWIRMNNFAKSLPWTAA